MTRATAVVVAAAAVLGIAVSIALLAAPMTVHAAASVANGPAHSVRCGRAANLVQSDFDSEGYDDGKCLPLAKRRFAGAVVTGGAAVIAFAALIVLGAVTQTRTTARTTGA